jgi:cytochrome c peroxidase
MIKHLAIVVMVAACAQDLPVSSATSDLQTTGPVHTPTGLIQTVTSAGSIDTNNEFFQDLGTNGRRCVSCHNPAAGWTITPTLLEKVFEDTDGGVEPDDFGLGAVFRPVDGANAPTADVSTVAARRAAYSMLLSKGLIRIRIGVPASAEFELIAVDDPYGYASAAELSLFRRPLPTTNLLDLSTVMFDGRETFPGKTIQFDLADQANGAMLAHAQGAPLTQAQRTSIVVFETALNTAATFDTLANDLTAAGATGGPKALAAQPFYLGINDLFGDSRTGAPFSSTVFTLYAKWATAPVSAARRAVARGEDLFNTKRIVITGVGGINDEAAFGNPASVNGTCTTCHDTPNVGDHSVSAPLNIGLVDASRRTPDLPLYTFRNKTTGDTISVTDPGRALISGRWKDIGKFKGPILRALPARAPYFHNGSAADLAAVVDFYDQRFQIGFTAQEKSDLIAFLRTL